MTPHTEPESLAALVDELVRVMDDDDWSHVLATGFDWTGTDDVAGLTVGPEHFAALLAELDRIAGELTPDERYALEDAGDPDGALAMGCDRVAGLGLVRAWTSEPGLVALTPLGRAVLARKAAQR